MKAIILIISLCLLSIVQQSSAEILVKGRGVDILDVGGSETAWLWRPDVSFPDNLPIRIRDKSVATCRYYPNPKPGRGGDNYDTRSDQGINSIRSDKPGKIIIALATDQAANCDWTLLRKDGQFTLKNGETYHLYEHTNRKLRAEVLMPTWRGSGREHPTLVFGERGDIRFENPLPMNGVVIDRTPYTISNATMVILPNGDYIANCSGVPHWKLWKSTDRGETWRRLAKPGLKINFQSIFEHRGSLYILGRSKNDPRAPFPTSGAIYKSTDGGLSWQGPSFIPVSLSAGVKLDTAQASVDIANGRLWRAVQGMTDGVHCPGLLSAPVDADLMDSASWSFAKGVRPNHDWITTSGRGLRFWDEGTTLVTREGVVGNIVKTGIYKTKKRAGTGEAGAAIIEAQSPTQSVFSPEHGFIELPGAGSKFSLRYDPVSDKYWALTSGGNPRNKLNLYSSSNLKKFIFEQEILSGPSSRFHGFNYPYMLLEGDDIVFVLRTAFETSRGQAQRWHDANLFTFHRIKDFRTLSHSSK